MIVILYILCSKL